MRQKATAILLIVICAFSLSACGAGNTPAANTASAPPAQFSEQTAASPVETSEQWEASSGDTIEPAASETPEEDVLPDAPKIEMLTQVYPNNSDAPDQIIEVPQLVSAKPSAAVDSINERILEFFSGYEKFSDGSEEVEWTQMKTYPLCDEKYMQIILTRIDFPNYATYGDIVAFCYDYQEDKELTLADMIEMDSLDLQNPENKLLGVIPEGFELKQFEPAAGAVSQLGNIYFYNVFTGTAETVEGEELKSLYIRYPDGSYDEYNQDKLTFGPVEAILVGMKPPLYWERG